MKVLVNAPMSLFSGYGNDGIGVIRALIRSGADVYLRPEHVDPPLPEDIAHLFTKRLEAPFDLYLSHVDPIHIDLPAYTARSSEINVGWTMWEFLSFSSAPKAGIKNAVRRFKNFDLMIGYDNVTNQALAPYAKKAGTPMAKLQGGFSPEFWQPAVERDWFGERFGFAMNGALHERKNPFAAIQAFKELKEAYPVEFFGAELHLHTLVGGLHPAMELWCPKLRIHQGVWPESLVRDFYRSQHYLLAPSRGEGKNLPALEMMTTGGGVIASDFGGHQAWLDPSYSYATNVDLEPFNKKFPDALMARVRVEHLKEQMLHVYRNRDEAKAKAELASEIIPKAYNWDRVVEKLFLTIKENVPGKGEKLWLKYKMLQPRSDIRSA